MSSLKKLLLKEASRRFEEQQQQQKDAAASSTTLMAPISPSPPRLIEEAMQRLAAERDPSTGDPLIGASGSNVTLLWFSSSFLIRLSFWRFGLTFESSRPTLVCGDIGMGAQIIDLGCGDGRWLCAAAKAFKSKNVRCVGYDLDEVLLAKARKEAAFLEASGAAIALGGGREVVPEVVENPSTTSKVVPPKAAESPLGVALSAAPAAAAAAAAAAAETPPSLLPPAPASAPAPQAQSLSLPTLQYHSCDLLTADVSQASVVIAYLFREGCAVVQDKLEKELPSRPLPRHGGHGGHDGGGGVAVLSVGFALKGWEAKWVLRPKGSVPLYFYTQVKRGEVELDSKNVC
jgi:tRNA G46 methylase TrmB